MICLELSQSSFLWQKEQLNIGNGRYQKDQFAMIYEFFFWQDIIKLDQIFYGNH